MLKYPIAKVKEQIKNKKKKKNFHLEWKANPVW